MKTENTEMDVLELSEASAAAIANAKAVKTNDVFKTSMAAFIK